MAFKLLSCLNQHTNHRLDTFKRNFRIMKDFYNDSYYVYINYIHRLAVL